MDKQLFGQLGIVTALIFSSPLHAELYNVVVAQDGSGDFKTIQEALAQAPDGDSQYTIYVKNGTYNERLEIERPNLYIIGESQDKTIITATTANGTLKDDGTTWGTTGSRTVNINAENFKARDLTIANGFDYPANQEKSDDDPTKIKSTQAVALLISDSGNHAQFKNVSLQGYQDTLYVKSPMNYFDQAKISGHIDFVFGYGGALIENSEIIARDRTDVSEGETYGYITAPATDIGQAFGLVFKNCALKKENPGMPAKSFALGRQWHPTKTFDDGRYADPNAIGHAAFINCNMDDHIYGWDKMSGKDIDGNTIWFYPQDSRFWEYHNSGPGATSHHATKDVYRPQLNDKQIKQYSNEKILDGWTPDISLPNDSKLKGEVLNPLMQFPAHISAIDSSGQKVVAKTDRQGRYELPISNMTLPIIVSADDSSGASCIKSDEKRSLCMSAIITDAEPGKTTTGNINPFTDVIVSGLANSVGIDGPQQLVEKGFVPALPLAELEKARANFEQAFGQDFHKKGKGKDKGKHKGHKDQPTLSPENYDKQDSNVMKKLTEKVLHNRGYNTTTGLASATTLTDLAFHPILNIDANPKYLVDEDQLDDVAHQVKSASTRVFLVGDSTVSNYEPDVYPRMGWGQAFDLQYSNRHFTIVNAARSGRSSRDYINGRWLSSLEPYVKPGDYLFIEFSHNDEKCNGANGDRGVVDVANLCTYPNSASGKVQFPQGKPEYSFQKSLERYLSFAKEHKMQPVFVTSTARAKTVDGSNGTPINPEQHVTKQNSSNGYAYFGSYTQTVLDTAKQHHVPVIDLQTASIELGNKAGENWTDIWLAVDPAQYPYYEGKTGSLATPDSTHFQKHGAEALTNIVVKQIKQEPKLKGLAKNLK
ncbi:MAG: pectinesterase family protein [Vibrio sp.]